MQTLVVVDAQNEFSEGGRRPIANHAADLAAIERRGVFEVHGVDLHGIGTEDQ